MWSGLLSVLERLVDNRVDLLRLLRLRDGRCASSPASSSISEWFRRACERKGLVAKVERERSACTHPKDVGLRSSWEVEVP